MAEVKNHNLSFTYFMKAVTNTLSVNVTSQKLKEKKKTRNKQKNNEKQGKKKIPQNKNKHHDPDVQNLSSL